MVLASILVAVIATIVLLVLCVVWAWSEKVLAKHQQQEIAFSLREELVKTLLFAVVAAAPWWINVQYIIDNSDDMPAEYYLGIPAVASAIGLAYLGLVIWRVSVSQKAEAIANAQATAQSRRSIYEVPKSKL